MGTGKSVLSAKVISQLRRKSDQAPAGSIVAYHFFDFNDNSTQTVEGMIRNLIRQIVSQAEDMPTSVMLQHEKRTAPEGFGSDLNLSHWTTVLIDILSVTPSLFIVIDALDECLEAEQALLTSTLQRIFSEDISGVKWILTSRPSPLFAGILSTEGCEHLSMQSQVIDKDIEPYLRARLDSEPALMSFSQGTKDLIIQKVSAKAGGM